MTAITLADFIDSFVGTCYEDTFTAEGLEVIYEDIIKNNVPSDPITVGSLYSEMSVLEIGINFDTYAIDIDEACEAVEIFTTLIGKTSNTVVFVNN